MSYFTSYLELSIKGIHFFSSYLTIQFPSHSKEVHCNEDGTLFWSADVTLPLNLYWLDFEKGIVEGRTVGEIGILFFLILHWKGPYDKEKANPSFSFIPARSLASKKAGSLFLGGDYVDYSFSVNANDQGTFDHCFSYNVALCTSPGIKRQWLTMIDGSICLGTTPESEIKCIRNKQEYTPKQHFFFFTSGDKFNLPFDNETLFTFGTYSYELTWHKLSFDEVRAWVHFPIFQRKRRHLTWKK